MNILDSKTIKALKNFCTTMTNNCSTIAFNMCDTDEHIALEYQYKAETYKEVLNYLKELG